MVGLHKQRHRIWKWLVTRKPLRLRVPMRAHNGQIPNLRVEPPGNRSHFFFGRKKPVFVEQSH